jgi:hypothetical protein
MKEKVAVPAELMNNLLMSIVAFMAKTGMSASAIDRACQSCVQTIQRDVSKTRSAKRPSILIGCDTAAGAILRAWHREPRYLDDSANPLPLHLRRGSKSLVSLVRSQDQSVDIGSLIEEMRRTGLIRRIRDGRYLPTTSAATIRQLHPLAIDHVAKTVMRLVETVNRNTHVIYRKKPLIERYAHVPDLDSREAQAFAEFTRQQGAACLEAIEDWLESRRRPAPRSDRNTAVSVNAGMHVFAYIGEPGDRKGRAPMERRKRPTSSRAIRA